MRWSVVFSWFVGLDWGCGSNSSELQGHQQSHQHQGGGNAEWQTPTELQQEPCGGGSDDAPQGRHGAPEPQRPALVGVGNRSRQETGNGGVCDGGPDGHQAEDGKDRGHAEASAHGDGRESARDEQQAHKNELHLAKTSHKVAYEAPLNDDGHNPEGEKHVGCEDRRLSVNFWKLGWVRLHAAIPEPHPLQPEADGVFHDGRGRRHDEHEHKQPRDPRPSL
ncbi:MAG TPA: hypothetical protein DIU15_12175 [Deltaproteobacteria bacterium]|nr:hypothetical protein [Deltaproteobacteria bacterium]HCP46794.1 hypothetical protein [Deltaproteobacteria bacterium]